MGKMFAGPNNNNYVNRAERLELINDRNRRMDADNEPGSGLKRNSSE